MKKAIESMQNTMAFSARDWSINSQDAWLYGIVCGWGHAIGEVAEQHGWSADAVERLRKHHRAFVHASRTPEIERAN